MNLLFAQPDTPSVPVSGESARFPVRRIFCVGRNYAAHARELGNTVDREAPITRAAAFGPMAAQRITLSQNGTVKQDASLAEMIWSLPELIAGLSRMYHRGPGDLVYTGTPAGVGAVSAGDRLEGMVEGLEPVRLAIAPAE
ncbi:MAG: fumarylacetoacetate hydrolase family protein [Novosphingobium sp.]